MKKYLSIILASVFLFACSPPDPGITSDIQVLNPGETYNTHVGKINSNFANLNTDKLEDAPSDGDIYGRQDGAWAIVPAGGGGAVDSVFGRTGAVVAESGDYASFYLALASCTTSGQIPKWNGSAWACATDETGSGSLPPGNAVNDILQWDGSTWAVQGFINGLIDDTAGDGDTTAVLSADKVFDELGLINEVPAGGTTGQVLGKASNTDHDVAWIDQTGSGGGVTSIIAGTNITIDPTSGLGDVTINAIGGAPGGYVPVPTYSDQTCTEGQYAVDRANNYIYWCYATNSWDRVPSTFDQWDNPQTVYYTLSISPTPSDGRITEPGDSTHINCGAGGNDCEEDYEDGTNVVLNAIAESGYELNTWSGTNLTDNGDGTATVLVDQDISDVTATFSEIPGGVTCDGDMESGDRESFEKGADQFCNTGWTETDVDSVINTYDSTWKNCGNTSLSIVASSNNTADNIVQVAFASPVTDIYERFYITFPTLDSGVYNRFHYISDDTEVARALCFSQIYNSSGVYRFITRDPVTNPTDYYVITPGETYRAELHVVQNAESEMVLYDSTGALMQTNDGQNSMVFTAFNYVIQYFTINDQSSGSTNSTLYIDDYVIRIGGTEWIGEDACD